MVGSRSSRKGAHANHRRVPPFVPPCAPLHPPGGPPAGRRPGLRSVCPWAGRELSGDRAFRGDGARGGHSSRSGSPRSFNEVHPAHEGAHAFRTRAPPRVCVGRTRRACGPRVRASATGPHLTPSPHPRRVSRGDSDHKGDIGGNTMSSLRRSDDRPFSNARRPSRAGPSSRRVSRGGAPPHSPWFAHHRSRNAKGDRARQGTAARP